MIRERLRTLCMLICWRLRVPLVVICAALIGAVAASATFAMMRDPVWPYDVLARRIVADQVEPGGPLGMQRLIDYHQEDCWRQYDRRVVSRVKDGPTAGTVFRPMPIVEQKLPIDLSGKWQTWSEDLPKEFPCGPAYLVESVTAACSWWQRNVRLLRKPDIITPFTVTGCDKPPPG